MPTPFKKFSYAVALVCLCAQAALAGESVRYEGRFPAKYPEAAKLTNVAVLPFTGKDGSNFSSSLTAELQSAALDGQPVFSVKTPDGINVAPAKPAKPGGEVAAAIRMGQKLGAQAVYMGEVTTANVTKTDRNEQRTTCVEPDGLFKCKRQASRTIVCTRVVVDYSVTPRALNVATGTVLYSETISDQGSYDVCDGQALPVNTSLADSWKSLSASFRSLTGPASPTDAPTNIYTEEALMLRIRGRVANKVRRQVAPYNAVVEVTFKKKAPELPKASQATFKGAVEFSNASRLDRACSIWETMNTGAAANSVSLLYNLGVCQEALLPDDPNAALEYYAKADQLLSSPDKLVSDAYLRTKKMVDGQRSIRR